MALLTSSGVHFGGPRPANWFRAGALLLVAVLSFAFSASRVEAQPNEYKIKAVFLFNFLQFVEWPEDAFPYPTSPLRIGVLGNDPFGAALDAAVQDETIEGRKLTVERSPRLEDLQHCHLLFISGSETRRLDSVLAQLDRQPVITVGEADGFARRGGVIGFYSDGRKVRFEINPVAARRKGLKLSSELLRLGRLVEGQSAAKGGS